MREMREMPSAWSYLLKRSAERANGRIHFYPGFWRLHGNNEGKPGSEGILFSDRTDELGRPMEMVTLRCLRCPLTKWEPKYAKYRNRYWIPARLCRKCDFYRKRRRGAWYACCGHNAAKNKSKAVAEELNEAWDNAIDFANSIIGKSTIKDGEDE